MRLVDLQLRCGPYGDHFGARSGGLTLERLKQAGGAIDLGPLEPCFPDILRTPGRRIQLADPLITGDVERLRARMAEREADVRLLLVGRRQARGMNSWLHNLPALAKGRPRCTLLVHPQDAAKNGLVDGGRARVRSRVGALDVDVEVSDEMACSSVLPGGSSGA